MSKYFKSNDYIEADTFFYNEVAKGVHKSITFYFSSIHLIGYYIETKVTGWMEGDILLKKFGIL